MKLETIKNDVETNVTNNHTFTIAANEFSFRVLSDGLYSDKIKAIIRELSSNAIDSHVAANNPEPFEIKLPNALDNSFYIKDYGIGLSRNDILGYVDDLGIYHTGIYNTFFSSTKQNSNDYIGMLGLGSKTPFNYTNSFYVISVFDGIESTYLCHLNDSYVPTVSLFTEVETSEHNGLTIKFNVEPKDFWKFKTALQSVYTYLTVKPNIVGDVIDISEIEYTVDKGFWKLRKNYYRNGGLYVIQGGVSYPVKHDTLYDRLNEKRGILEQDIDLFVNIGDVEVAASREQLSYTNKTIDFLFDKITSIYDDYKKDIDDLISNAKTIKDLCNIEQPLYLSNLTWVFKDSIRKKCSEILDGNKYIKIRSENHDIIEFIYGNFSIIPYHYGYGKWSRIIKSVDDLNIYGSNKSLLIVNKHKLTKVQISELCDYYLKHGIKCIYVMNIINKDFDNVEDVFDCFDKVVYTVPVKREKVTRIEKPKTIEIYSWSGYRSSALKYSSYCWNTHYDFDYSKGGIYVDVKKFAVMFNDSEIEDFSDVVRIARNMNILNGKVYGITEKNKQYLNDDWVNLFDLINAKVKLSENDVKYLLYKELKQQYDWLLDGLKYVEKYKLSGDVLKCCEFLKDMVKYSNRKDECELYVQLYGNQKYFEYKNYLNSLIGNIKTKYPLLKHLYVKRWYYKNEYETLIDELYTYLS